MISPKQKNTFHVTWLRIGTGSQLPIEEPLTVAWWKSAFGAAKLFKQRAMKLDFRRSTPHFSWVKKVFHGSKELCFWMIPNHDGSSLINGCFAYLQLGGGFNVFVFHLRKWWGNGLPKQAHNPRSISWRWQVSNLDNSTFFGSCIQKSSWGIVGPHFGDRLQDNVCFRRLKRNMGRFKKRCVGWSERYNREREREHEWGKDGIKEGPTYASMSLRFPGGEKHENRVAIMNHLHWSCRTPVRCWSRLPSQRFVFARWSTLWPLLLGTRWLQPLVGTATRSAPWTVIKVLMAEQARMSCPSRPLTTCHLSSKRPWRLTSSLSHLPRLAEELGAKEFKARTPARTAWTDFWREANTKYLAGCLPNQSGRHEKCFSRVQYLILSFLLAGVLSFLFGFVSHHVGQPVLESSLGKASVGSSSSEALEHSNSFPSGSLRSFVHRQFIH